MGHVFLASWQPISVVAVVGMGHVPGIIANWNKRIDVGDLLMLVLFYHFIHRNRHAEVRSRSFISFFHISMAIYRRTLSCAV